MSGHPIRKEELLALETMARGQANAVSTDEAILDRLAKLGLIAQRGGRWSLVSRLGSRMSADIEGGSDQECRVVDFAAVEQHVRVQIEMNLGGVSELGAGFSDGRSAEMPERCSAVVEVVG